MSELFVPIPEGLSGPCAEEVRAAGAGEVREGPDGISCTGGVAELMRLNLTLRIGSRVLLRLSSGPVEKLRQVAAAAPWATVLPRGASFELSTTGGGRNPASLMRPVAAALIAAVPGAREAPGGMPIHLRLEGGTVTISADSSGEHLHRRGYRQEPGAAPLRETLAAGILSLAGYTGDSPLVDPMCGSGTFLLEGARLSLRRAPGIGRSFACESWPSVPPALVAAERERLRAAERKVAPAPILGSDLNAGALGVARRNAGKAGVLLQLKLSRLDAVLAEPPPGGPGVIVANLPYGLRVGEAEELSSLYRRFGARLREKFSGYTAALLLAEERRIPTLALPRPRTVPLRNGGLPVTLVLSQL